MHTFSNILNMLQNVGRYAWSDNWSVMYTNWGPHQPDVITESCAYMGYEDGGWRDNDCAGTFWVLCKHSLSKLQYIFTSR